jgi:hypothetical protein
MTRQHFVTTSLTLHWTQNKEVSFFVVPSKGNVIPVVTVTSLTHHLQEVDWYSGETDSQSSSLEGDPQQQDRRHCLGDMVERKHEATSSSEQWCHHKLESGSATQVM